MGERGLQLCTRFIKNGLLLMAYFAYVYVSKSYKTTKGNILKSVKLGQKATKRLSHELVMINNNSM